MSRRIGEEENLSTPKEKKGRKKNKREERFSL